MVAKMIMALENKYRKCRQASGGRQCRQWRRENVAWRQPMGNENGGQRRKWRNGEMAWQWRNNVAMTWRQPGVGISW